MPHSCQIFASAMQFGAVGEKWMFVTRANALSATSFMASRFSIIALTATKSAFRDQVFGRKSMKLEAAGRSFESA